MPARSSGKAGSPPATPTRSAPHTPSHRPGRGGGVWAAAQPRTAPAPAVRSAPTAYRSDQTGSGEDEALAHPRQPLPPSHNATPTLNHNISNTLSGRWVDDDAH